MTTDRYGEILLDGMKFRLAAPVPVNALASFQAKLTFGDYTRDSNQLLSSWITGDLSGGHGAVELNEGTQQNRYRFGTLYTRHPNQISLPRKVLEITAYNGAALPFQSKVRPAGDLVEAGVTRFFATARNAGITYDLIRWDEVAKTFGAALGAMPNPQANPGVAFQGTGATRKLFIPHTAGYTTWSTGGVYANVAAGANDPGAIAFCVWDNKLVALDSAGQLWYTTSGNAASFVSWGATAKLDTAYTPRNIVQLRDRSDNWVIHVITDRDVWAFDAAGPSLYLTDLQFPPGPYQGLGSATWRGNLYTTVGMGVHQYTGSSIDPVGLDRDDGLPLNWRGYIYALAAEYNGLYALVLGPTTIAAGATARSLQVYTGFGWHTEWSGVQSASPGESGGLMVSNAQSAYRLWWSTDDARLWTINLPIDFANPLALTTDIVGDFAADGTTYYLETGWFDASMKGYTKIASHLTLSIGGSMINSTITVKYRTNGGTSYTTLGTITTTGISTLEFGTADADGITPGQAFEKIELRLEVVKSSGVTTSPLIEDVTLGFLKVVKNSFSWELQLDLSTRFHDQSPENMSAKLDALIASTSFFTMKHLNVASRTRISQFNGDNASGMDSRGHRTVGVLQIPVGF